MNHKTGASFLATSDADPYAVAFFSGESVGDEHAAIGLTAEMRVDACGKEAVEQVIARLWHVEGSRWGDVAARSCGAGMPEGLEEIGASVPRPERRIFGGCLLRVTLLLSLLLELVPQLR